ncbi:tetratricopeptide repeat protein [Mucilaginibacter litoreus]|uniref:histidine kinase n=1 Tax=Mucilaginibacter litoreus TaxID=1048221 RepID=A0ABW3AV77_9SPHI
MLKSLTIAFVFPFLMLQTVRAEMRQVPAIQHEQVGINKDTLISILTQTDDFQREKRLISFSKSCIQASENDKLQAVEDTLSGFFSKYNLPNKDIFLIFIKGVAFNKLHDLKQAEAYMAKAVQIAGKNNQDYLMFQMLSHLGFVQTDKGDYIGAIYNYRLATIEVRKLRDKFTDNRRESSLNINISDLFYKTGFYSQSLAYLDKAWALLDNDTTSKRLLSSVIFYNKSENYFRMNNLDSVKAYHNRLNEPGATNYKLYTYRKRTEYYISLLQHNYATAIQQIKALQKSKDYAPSELEDQHLADAFYQNKQLDSARAVINKLLLAEGESNHPEIKYHLYETLARIAEKEGDYKASAYNFMLALKQSQANNIRLSQVGNISSQIKLDETESSFLEKTAIYKKERLWLLFIVSVSTLSLVAIGLFYRNVKQKRHYEKLLFEAKKEELAFINSHEVRKHLTNILGIIDILKHSDNKVEEYRQIEEYLQQSASLLDESIKNISEKLNE